MTMARHVFTSESVTEGHPDKIADQISDAVLDAILGPDPEARVACETLVTTGLALVAGEITSKCVIDYAAIVRKTVEQIGYTDAAFGFDSNCIRMREVASSITSIALSGRKRSRRYRRESLTANPRLSSGSRTE